jgi:hypothetical protein
MSDNENDDRSNTQPDFRVCEGQTEEERREIRKQQRLLQKDLEEQGESLELEEARDRNNEIFANVRFIREAVLDGENVNLIANKAAQKVDKLIQVRKLIDLECLMRSSCSAAVLTFFEHLVPSQVPRYDADRVVSKLVSKLRSASGGGTFFDWRKLGVEAGVCFNAVPSNVTFLNGPLQDGQEEVVVRQRVAPRRRAQVEEHNPEERPEDVQGHTERGSDQLSAVQKNINDVAAALAKKVDDAYRRHKRTLLRKYGSEENIPERAKKRLKKNPEVCMVELLFNPKSFTQTVENIFHYSFLVKSGKAKLSIRKKDVEVDESIILPAGPVVVYVKDDKDGRPVQTPPPKQGIVNLTMKDWRELITTYNVTKSDVPHRTGSKYQRETSATGPAQHEYEQSDNEEAGE